MLIKDILLARLAWDKYVSTTIQEPVTVCQSMLYSFKTTYVACFLNVRVCVSVREFVCTFVHTSFHHHRAWERGGCARAHVCARSLVRKARVRSEGGNEEHCLLDKPYLTKVLPSRLRGEDGKGHYKGHCEKGLIPQPTDVTLVSKRVIKESFRYTVLKVLWAVLKESQPHKSGLLIRLPFGV